MKIAIRADGGSIIGMGHIMRTLVLAKELAKTNDVFYVCRVDNPLSDKYSYGIEKIKKEGFNLITINENNLVDELEKIEADCLITDSYDVDENYFMKTKVLFKKTGYFDDMNLYYFDVDFIINQNINAEDLKYNTDKRTKLLLGTSFVLLREEFRETQTKILKANVNDILITLGGSDFNNYTGRILEFIRKLEYKFHVVVGPSFNHVDELKEYENEYNNIKLYFNANIKELIRKCDLAISACGSTIYELSACGLPTIGLVVAENQSEIAKKMEEKEAIINLGNIEDLNKDKLVNILSMLSCNLDRRIELTSNQITIINKNGVEKLCSSINSMIYY
ncbi:UDP-2,4-diacetamido-2,4,6-trideoxy-beta-L-altropyranose hydrolase [Clostridium sp. UBA1056]|uniref:UDP-2,4-diacetamido-2,4, 6-trideoxy-beta-L-altropyranose hydrolase n=1 Tax=unclassified Clostridium TaxID=2614128 RepID=UPI003216E23C